MTGIWDTSYKVRTEAKPTALPRQSTHTTGRRNYDLTEDPKIILCIWKRQKSLSTTEQKCNFIVTPLVFLFESCYKIELKESEVKKDLTV